MKRAIGLEHLNLLEIAPPELVTLAAASGFDTVGLRVGPVTPDEATWPLHPGAPRVAAVDPALLTYLQLCDAPRQQPHGLGVPVAMPRGRRAAAGDDRVLEARTMPLLPGEGELPLAALLAALPGDMLVSVEAPSAAALAATSPDGYAARAR